MGGGGTGRRRRRPAGRKPPRPPRRRAWPREAPCRTAGTASPPGAPPARKRNGRSRSAAARRGSR
eukprot:1519176-Lingulodinium_polyedra.AAC.1